ncbi:hypothetical protein LMG23992_00836 [Cupriavidus laharis]|uniref:DUF3108 domain-containing protein n=1 Tax=Cupriavidus laharis TaxID=151654 RepID=A0ABM8WJG6_9BURK|nr:hypothetical protein [Cupriavidus laharis]CAG9167548.1 hypothetical protein LMG23992_00836 [Cupriavidus laharis]
MLAAAWLALGLAGVTPQRAYAGQICDAPYIHDGGRIRFEADGLTPMTTLAFVSKVDDLERDMCSLNLDIYSKSALRRLMGPPVETVQRHRVVIDERSGQPIVHSLNARVQAYGQYTELIGEMSTNSNGLLLYPPALVEGQVLPPETFVSRYDFRIVDRRTGSKVSELEASSVRLTLSERRVGPLQRLQLASGSLLCWPIRYTKFIDLGGFRLDDVVVDLEPTVLDMTDWYCPARRFVMRQEVRYKNQLQVIDVVEIE